MPIKIDKANLLTINPVIFSPDSGSLAYIASAPNPSYTGTKSDISLGLWELKRGEVKKATKTIQHKIETIFFSPDGDNLALMYHARHKTNYGFIWNIAHNKLSEKQSYMPDYLGPESIVVMSPDKKFTAQPDLKGRIRLWNNITKKIIKTYQFEHIKTINAIQFTPDSKRLTIVGQYSPPYRYNTSEKNKYQGPTLIISFDLFGKNKNQILDTKSTFLSFQKKDHRLLTDIRDTVEIWNGFKQTLIQKIEYIGAMKQIHLSNNGHFMAAVIHSNLIILPEDKPIEMKNRRIVIIWDIKTGQPFHVLTEGTNTTTSLSISPDNKTLATGDEQGVIRLWDMKTGKLIKHLFISGFPSS